MAIVGKVFTLQAEDSKTSETGLAGNYMLNMEVPCERWLLLRKDSSIHIQRSIWMEVISKQILLQEEYSNKYNKDTVEVVVVERILILNIAICAS